MDSQETGPADTTKPSRERAARRPVVEVLQDRNYRLFFPAGLFTQMGRWMWFLVSGYLVLQLSDSTFLTQMVGVASTAPLLLVGVAIGVIADSFDRRRLLLVGLGVNLVTSVIAAFLVFSGNVNEWQIILLTFVIGASLTMDQITRRSFIPDLVKREVLAYGIALDTMNMTAGIMAGPFIAGLLLDFLPERAFLNVAWTYLAATLMFSAAAVLVYGVQPQNLPRRLGLKPSSIFTSVADGFRVIAGNRAIIGVFGITILFNLTFPPHTPLIPVFAQKVLQVSPTAMGVLAAASGLGALIGTIFIVSRREIARKSLYYYSGTLACMVFLFVFGVSNTFPLSFAALVLAGMGMSGFGTMQATLVLLSVSEDMRGRLMGIQSMAIGVLPLGSLIMGALAEIWSPQQAVAAVALVGFALTVIWVTFAREMRRL